MEGVARRVRGPLPAHLGRGDRPRGGAAGGGEGLSAAPQAVLKLVALPAPVRGRWWTLYVPSNSRASTGSAGVLPWSRPSRDGLGVGPSLIIKRINHKNP